MPSRSRSISSTTPIRNSPRYLSAPAPACRGWATPIGGDFGEAYAIFLDQQKAKGMPVGTVALINENTEYGTSVGDAIVKALTAHGYKVDLRIPYAVASTDVSTQVLQLKQANPAVAIFVSYTSDAILFTKN